MQNSQSRSQMPYLKIVEQPAYKKLRFRYKCECDKNRSAGSIPGVNSTPEHKTFPTVEVVGYKGDVAIVVSCVTKDPPYRPHPHNLVGKENCKDGICQIKVRGENPRAVFSNLGVQCVKRMEVRESLELREKLKVDPFNTRFAHKDQKESLDLNIVRLCFQAFLDPGGKTIPLAPVVSDLIHDRKATSDLMVSRLCSCAAKVGGGDEIIMLCEKVSKDDIKIRFFEVNNDDSVIWEAFAEFQQTDIHKNTAIAFKTPRYRNTDITEKAKVFLQLVRPSDGETSERIPFEYFPDPDQLKRKRLKSAGYAVKMAKLESQQNEPIPNPQFQNDLKTISNFMDCAFMNDIKVEPAISPQNFNTYRSPYHMSPSPQPQSPVNYNAASPQHMQQQQCNYGNPFLDIGADNPYGNGNTINNGNNANNGNSNMLNNLLSGGSITPIVQNLNSPNNIANEQQLSPTNMIDLQSISPQQPLQQQQQYYQASVMNITVPVSTTNCQYQMAGGDFMQQLPNDIEMLATGAEEEAPTLSGLLAYMDNEQFVNLTSEDLKLSNLSITT